MQIAQRLYEAGHITYHRTDGADVAPEAQDATRRFIAQTCGGDYVPNQPPVYQAKAEHAQEAHEAIRPTDVRRLPQEVEGDGVALYSLIWRRFVASQMAPARYAVQVVEILVGKTLGQAYPLSFRVKSRTLVFDGFLKIYQDPPDPDAEPEENPLLPPLSEGVALRLVGWLPVERQTQAPPRFTEASLVRELERLGIGRPSTYASMLQTLKQHDYVKLQKERLVPTNTGTLLCDSGGALPGPVRGGLHRPSRRSVDVVALAKQAPQCVESFLTDFTPVGRCRSGRPAANPSPPPHPTDRPAVRRWW